MRVEIVLSSSQMLNKFSTLKFTCFTQKKSYLISINLKSQKGTMFTDLIFSIN